VTPAGLIETHGYWVLVAGCLLEGEMVLILAGFAARRGYLDPLAVLAVASLTAFASNQLFFWVGRHHGRAVLARWPALARHAAGIGRLIERHPSVAAISVRFVYGTRIVGPILIGMSSMTPRWFAMLNGVSALVWASIVGAAGWLFGTAAEHLVQSFSQVEGWLAAALVMAVIFWRVLARISSNRRRRRVMQ